MNAPLKDPLKYEIRPNPQVLVIIDIISIVIIVSTIIASGFFGFCARSATFVLFDDILGLSDHANPQVLVIIDIISIIIIVSTIVEVEKVSEIFRKMFRKNFNENYKKMNHPVLVCIKTMKR